MFKRSPLCWHRSSAIALAPTGSPRLALERARKASTCYQRRWFDPLVGIGASAAMLYFSVRHSSQKLDAFLANVGHVATWRHPRFPDRLTTVHFDVVNPLSVVPTPTASSEDKPTIATRDVVVFFHDAPGGCDQYRSLSLAGNFLLPYSVITVSRPGYLQAEQQKQRMFYAVE